MTEDKGILIKNVYYMLAYAFQELKQNNFEEIQGETFDDIYDLFAEILARGISYQLKQGLYREYVPKNESLQTIRGKINLNETIVNRSRNNRQISCDFDELSENNIYNQILLTTATLLIRHSDVKKEQKAKLKKLMLFFQNVETVELRTIRWKALRFDRNNRNYRMLIYICYFIVSEWLLTTEAGNHKLPQFTEEHMCHLFEKFVLAYYKKHHPELKPCAKQINWNVVEEATDISVLPIMQSDILLTLAERTLIIDTKYYSKIMQKQYDKESIRNSHINQVYIYVNEYDREKKHNVDGMLLYAKTNEDFLDDAQIAFEDGYSIFVKTLNLNDDFDGIKSRLESFVS